EMAKRYVMLDPMKREQIFIEETRKKLGLISGHIREDNELMAVVRNLFEYPFVILGSFPKEYLAVPQEILICEMAAHQKCFAVLDKNGQIMPYFITSAGVKPFDEEVFAKGNARVLKARFEDGAFYFALDKKKTLKEHAELLKGLVFERELGSMADKAFRIERTALNLAQSLQVDIKEKALIEMAAPLLKADLVTGVVGQFPELQGVMGRIYAQVEGLPPDVCQAIETHYWPRFAEDQLPPSRAVALLSIADKLDTVVGIIGIGKRPKGNKDPFGLRRAAIGIVRMMVHFGFSMELKELIDIAINSYGDFFAAKKASLKNEVEEFIIQRARGLLIEDLALENEERAVSFADSILAVGSSDLVDVFARAHMLYAMRNKNRDDFESLTQTFKRAGNIVKKAREAGEIIASFEAIPAHLALPSEQELLKEVQKTRALIKKGQAERLGANAMRASYADLFGQVAMIKPKLDAFFDGVMVMVDDPELRKARLGLLSEIKAVADKIADFTHL
ncbi:MAG TPA: glycine--tRNA ligase subunit beta, partial [Myxococcota bacterium]|nr:glycine--tRNA ligase subunit beta [Myxococcota bacterium]